MLDSLYFCYYSYFDSYCRTIYYRSYKNVSIGRFVWRSGRWFTRQFNFCIRCEKSLRLHSTLPLSLCVYCLRKYITYQTKKRQHRVAIVKRHASYMIYYWIKIFVLQMKHDHILYFIVISNYSKHECYTFL